MSQKKPTGLAKAQRVCCGEPRGKENMTLSEGAEGQSEKAK